MRPSLFAGVSPHMRIATEGIFGPVISIMPYETEKAVIQEANNSVYSLAAYVQSVAQVPT